MEKLKRFRKYSHAFPSIVYQSKEINKLKKANALAREVANAFLRVKKMNYTEQEKEIFLDLSNYRTKLLSSNERITYEEFNSPLK